MAYGKKLSKSGSKQAKRNVARSIGEAKERVKQQDFDKKHGPATLSPLVGSLRKKAQKKRVKKAGDKAVAAYDRKGMKETKGRK